MCTTGHASALDNRAASNHFAHMSEPSSRGPPLLHLQTVTIKTLTVEPTRGVKPAEGAPASKQVEAGGSGGGTAGAARTDVSKVSASPFAALGGLGGLGSGVTVLGGGGSGGMLSAPLSSLGPVMSTAKERAAAAARRVPSPEPQPRKEKKKKVAWLAEEALVGVRWFRKVSGGIWARVEGRLGLGIWGACGPDGTGRGVVPLLGVVLLTFAGRLPMWCCLPRLRASRETAGARTWCLMPHAPPFRTPARPRLQDDPPSAAQEDVDLTKASAAPTATAAREASPPGFESAAKKEHLSEAEALRRHRQEVRMPGWGACTSCITPWSWPCTLLACCRP